MRVVMDDNLEGLRQIQPFKDLVHQKDRNGNSPLHTAAKFGSCHLITTLLQDLFISHKNFLGQTPLNLAIIHDHPQLVSLLLENKAPLTVINKT